MFACRSHMVKQLVNALAVLQTSPELEQLRVNCSRHLLLVPPLTLQGPPPAFRTSCSSSSPAQLPLFPVRASRFQTLRILLSLCMVCLPPIGDVLLQIRRQGGSDDDTGHSRIVLSTGAIFGIALSSAFSMTIIIVAIVACVVIRRRERRQSGPLPLGSEPSRSRAPTPSMMTQASSSYGPSNFSHAMSTVPSQNHTNSDRLQRARETQSASALALSTEADLAHPGTAASSRSERTLMGARVNSPHSTHSAQSGVSLAAVEAALLESAREAHLPPPAVSSLIQSLRRTFQGSSDLYDRQTEAVGPLPHMGRRYVLADDDRSQRPLRRWATIAATSTADSYETWEPGSSDLVAPRHR